MEANVSLNQDLNGKRIIQLRIDYALSLLCENGSLITIEADFKLTHNAKERHIQISKMDDVAHVLPILHNTITNIEIKNGTLHIQLPLHELEIQPMSQYEAWNITLANHKRYICMLGGEIAVFS